MKTIFSFFLIMNVLTCFGQTRKESTDFLTSENYPKLKEKFKQHPEYDTNKDGILTDAEYKAGKGPKNKNAIKVPEYCDFIPDINYAGTDNTKQCLDVFIPRNRSSEKLPAIVYIHGGGWKGGSKSRGPKKFEPYITTGKYVGFAVDYRLSDEAIWPAQINDCKAAIRWVKAHAKEYNIDPNRVAAFGGSAGGHLVAMLALTSASGEFEGEIGNHLDQDGSVNCVVNGYGPSELLTMDARQGKFSHNAANSPESRLIGAPIQENKEKAINASTTTWVSKKCVPMLIYHGTEDISVIVDQSETLYQKLNDANAKDIYFIRAIGGSHGVSHPKITEQMLNFFDKYLYGEEVKVDDSDFTFE